MHSTAYQDRRPEFERWRRKRRERLDALATALRTGGDPEPYLSDSINEALDCATGATHHAYGCLYHGDEEGAQMLRRMSDAHGAFAFACLDYREAGLSLESALAEYRATLP